MGWVLSEGPLSPGGKSVREKLQQSFKASSVHPTGLRVLFTWALGLGLPVPLVSCEVREWQVKAPWGELPQPRPFAGAPRVAPTLPSPADITDPSERDSPRPCSPSEDPQK